MKSPWWILGSLFLFLLIFLVWREYPSWVFDIFPILDQEVEANNLGVFGDSFGALNTLFSGLAFSGIVISIFLQSRELAETRREIREQNDQFVAQTRIMHLQAFESTFFQLLRMHNENVSFLEIYTDDSPKRGRQALRELYVKYKRRDHLAELGVKSNELVDKDMHYMYFYDCHGVLLSPYYRTIHKVLSFIDNNDVVQDKTFYAGLLKSQLSTYETALIFYHALSQHGAALSKALIEKYALLENLGDFDDIENEEITRFCKSAYGSNSVLLRAFTSA